jgi:hypothetical protein
MTPLPADARAHALTIVSAMLAEEIHALYLPGDVAGRILSLVEQIERHAQILSGKAVSFAAPEPARSTFGANVVVLRPRSRRL